ncbi:hypothetical protein A1O3_09247 [Capronia epimyces CBS 606.96]|uniref:Uncharacterized protein n=1 Tax=Capronia epimyces CBS 606.96 TaxID=1182542 RepID=W9XM81_9EURO|nr:uncharacterized protein A1O3_09247 [Capronia epimyces CBS 606.96]EXJ78086.1 hypothetical protein A1O3_09247 [Capronia epimyces CBS 606.96]
MCGDSHLPPARESGDLIAIIHPNPNPNPNQHAMFRGRLKLSNRLPGRTTSTLQCESDGPWQGNGNGNRNKSDCGAVGDRLLHVRIHKFGQPLSLDGDKITDSKSTASSDSSSDSESEPESEETWSSSNPVLHSFFVDTVAASSNAETRLNLGVGGDGVVGRTVSVSVFDGCRRKVLGEGIIGWS